MNNNDSLLHHYLDELYACGGEPGGGAYRPLYGPAWSLAGSKVSGWMQEAGLAVRRDAAGNLWGRLEGREAGKAVVTGSHLDTVRGGGRLDGALGIVAGIVAIRALRRAHGAPRQPVEVLATCEEEGSRFATNFWGARAVIGAATAEEAESVTDPLGVTLATAMGEVGLSPRELPSAVRRDLDTFLELHIEQGAVLETALRSLGVVRAIVGTQHLEVVVTGRPDHAGTTPMALRLDALAGAASMIQAIERVAREVGEPAVATVGKLDVEPSQVNVVPGRATFIVDLRHSDPGRLRVLAQRVQRACEEVGSARGLPTEITVRGARDPVPMDPQITETLTRAAGEEGIEPLSMVSGAGHDAQVLASCCRTGMLFVPSIGGRSHCPEEATAADDLVRGTRVLARALGKLAWGL